MEHADHTDADDTTLLRAYAQVRSEAAFEQLVERHVDLVYSAALRQVNNDAHKAAEVTQVVFNDLARKAASLVGHPALAGWLYTSTHWAAKMLMRADRSRAKYERAAAEETAVLGSSPHVAGAGESMDWEQARPVLDDAMARLNETDRIAVVMRFFNNKSFAEVGARLGLGENAARMRVSRALEKLRYNLVRRGVTSSAGALGAALAANAVSAAPAGMAAAVGSVAVAAGAGASSAGLALSTLKTTAGIFVMSKTTTTILGVAILALIFSVGMQVRHWIADTTRAPAQPLAMASQTLAEAAAGDDARVLLARLQHEGFPPHILRAIAHAKLALKYAGPRARLDYSLPYWRSNSMGPQAQMSRRDPMRVAEARTLENEYNAEFDALVSDVPASGASAASAAFERRIYGDLPAEKIAMLSGIRDDYDIMRQKLRAEMSSITFPGDDAQLKLLDQEERADIEKSLTPEELRIYDLHSGATAQKVQGQIMYFGATEAEYIALFDVQRAFEREYGNFKLSAAEARAVLEAEIKTVLTPERFEEYKIATSSSYAPTRRFVESLNLPDAAVAQVIRLQNSAADQTERIRNDKSLTNEQRASQLANVARAASSELQAVLGSDGFGSYKKTAVGGWLQKMSADSGR